MPDYQKMYYVLCSEASRALDILPPMPANAAAREILEKALDAAEEIYINTDNILKLPDSLAEESAEE